MCHLAVQSIFSTALNMIDVLRQYSQTRSNISLAQGLSSKTRQPSKSSLNPVINPIFQSTYLLLLSILNSNLAQLTSQLLIGFSQSNEVSHPVRSTIPLLNNNSIPKQSIISLLSQIHCRLGSITGIGQEVLNCQRFLSLCIQSSSSQSTRCVVLQSILHRYLHELEDIRLFVTHCESMGYKSIRRLINIRVQAINQELILIMIQTSNLNPVSFDNGLDIGLDVIQSLSQMVYMFSTSSATIQ